MTAIRFSEGNFITFQEFKPFQTLVLREVGTCILKMWKSDLIVWCHALI